ncbi:ANTAR domain-containing protein [Pseudofrankia sp. BMG5.37]|uniref:ANTAR domain-containing protein n=1 Tax=Pseudofrankia sp. BMG5.36 TaxID=1834512 RepID=UPI001F51AED1|nr:MULTISPECIES: ANTAR domain-containing protein [unclassified Pseudofrankia]MDT3441183.1 ANTAR domain-containing protein [Pseudofrankia sp. BMG5.37]
MEATGFVEISATTATYLQVVGTLPGLDPGTQFPRSASLAARVLDGAPAIGTNVGMEPSLADTAEHERLGVGSHVVVPVLTRTGELAGLLVGLDRGAVEVGPTALPLLRGIADGLGAAWPADGATPAAAPPAAPSTAGETSTSAVPGVPSLGPPRPGPGQRGVPSTAPGAAAGPPVTGPGRAVPGPGPLAGGAAGAARAPRPGPPPRPGPRPGPPPRAAAPHPAQPSTAPPGAAPGAGGEMRLRRTGAGWVVEGPGTDVRPVGDLISAMVLADLLAEDLNPPGRPRRADRELGEIEKLRLSVVQLEHALASRVIVEQAIGVLAERHHIKPRDAFERLRRTARGMGRRVHDLARQVVESVSDPRIALPGELGGRPGPGAAAGPGPGTAPRPTPPRPTPTRH